MFVKYGSHRTLSVSFVKVDIINGTYAAQRTSNHRQQHTSSVKREQEINCFDVDASVLLQLLA